MMSPSTFVVLLSILVGAIIFYHHRSSNGRRKQLPPGPRPLPVIGNIHMMLRGLPHLTLQNLSKKYGPIMSLRLGSTPTIVVSSPEAAELFLKTHDKVFGSRPKDQVSDYLAYGDKGIAFTEYGPYWQRVRKLSLVGLMSAAKIDSYREMRKEEMAVAVESIKAAPPGEAVDVTEIIDKVVKDMAYRMVFGRRSDQSLDLTGFVYQATELTMGAFNLSDYVPVLAMFDLQGFSRRMKSTIKTADKILEKLIDEHEKEEESRVNDQIPRSDFIHELLSLMNKSRPDNIHDDNLSYSDIIDRDNIKAIVLDMLVGAHGATYMTINWIMAELMRHPRVMKKVQDEVNSVVDEDRMVDENDLSKFKYLDMVIKESLRFHPGAPLLLPRESMEDIVINDYLIPKKSRIIVNYWALSRDPNVWSENVEEFIPERFADGEIDIRGRHFQILPFGAGRRGCPGINLGMTTIRLVLAQMVHCFIWKLPNGMSPGDVDMTEKIGKATDLFAVPTYRLRI